MYQRIRSDVSLTRINTRSKELWEKPFTDSAAGYAAQWMCLYFQTLGTWCSFNLNDILSFNENLVVDCTAPGYLAFGINNLLSNGYLRGSPAHLRPTEKFFNRIKDIIEDRVD